MGQSNSITLGVKSGSSVTLTDEQALTLATEGLLDELKLDVLTDESILILQHYVRNLIKTIAKVLAQVDKIKADTFIQETEKQLEQMNKKKKGGLLGLLMKIFTAIAVALGCLVSIATFNFQNVALLIALVVVAMDFYISDACGKESLVSQAIGGLMRELMEALGEKAGAALGAVILVIITVLTIVVCRSFSGASSSAAKAGDAAKNAKAATDAASKAGAAGNASSAVKAGGEAANEMAKLRQLMEQLKKLGEEIKASCDKMCKFFGDLMKGKNLAYFVDLLEFTFFAAKSGVDVAGAINQIDIAKLMKLVADLSAEADFIASVCEQIKYGLKREFDRLGIVSSTIHQLNPIHA